jgi:hypothetical protein
MFKRIFGLLALAFSLFGTQSWAQSCGVEESDCHTFTPNSTTFTYRFLDGSQITVQFDTVLTTFDLRVSVSHPTNPLPLDPNEFPANTVCVQYSSNAPNTCDQYDFTGNAGGPNGVPVKNKDYKGLITLTLEYFSSQTANTPAFGHAPGDITTFTENILTGYSNFPFSDPTMGGTLPGLSSVVALDEPLTESDTYCWVSPATDGQTSTVGETIEVSFRLFPSGLCPNNAGTPIRDKTATLSLSTTDTNGNVVFPPHLAKEEANKFHWDNKNGLNEFDLSTEGLQPGTYTITVFSSKFSPQSRQINLTPRTGMVCLPLSTGVSCF